MAKPEPPRDKYFLRSLHQEIDFYDRKLDYLGKYEVFATPEDKKVAESKLQTKRAALERTAKQLAASGVEFNDAELPARSALILIQWAKRVQRTFRRKPESRFSHPEVSHIAGIPLRDTRGGIKFRP